MPNRIQQQRLKLKGWSASRLAKAMGVSRQQIRRLERGQRKLSQDWMERIADKLGCQPQDLLNGLASDAAAPDASTEVQFQILEALQEIKGMLSRQPEQPTKKRRPFRQPQSSRSRS